jgi:hypothetical protein
MWVVDSTPVECGRSRETAKRSELAGWAQYAYCASHSRYFWGLRLHLVCTLHGLPVVVALTGAKADERQVLLDLLATEPHLVAARPGQVLIADRHYYVGQFERMLAGLGLRLLRPARKGEAERAGAQLFKRCASSSSRSTRPSRASWTCSSKWNVEHDGDHALHGVPRQLLGFCRLHASTSL